MKPFLPLVLTMLVGCRGIQSALDPQGPVADSIFQITWVLFAGGTAIFLLVMAMAGWALFAPDRYRHAMTGEKFVLGWGFAFPVVVLTALLGYTLAVGISLPHRGGPDALRIRVSGEQWWWRVTYLEKDGSTAFATANELHIPVGRKIELELTSPDVIHSFWVPNLAGKLDMMPGRTNRMVIEAAATGIFRGQCAEYCGGPHAMMSFYVVAHSPEGFARWLERERAPGREPDRPHLVEGRRIFEESGCGACHAVRGTAATGIIGPDLTRIGSRLSLGAGTLDNNRGNLAGWIVDSQHLKPENRMPSFNQFDGPSLRALTAYVESLK